MIRRWALPLLLLAFGLFYLLPLGTHGLWIPDETRYAQISQEMLLSGKWVSPHFMGIRYFEKPAAGYWMIAIGQAIFGQNLFGVRFASALSTGLSIVLVYLVSRRLWNNPQKSLVSTVLYMSFVSVALLGGYANLDPQFTFWVNLTGVALWFCFDCTTRRGRLWSWALLGFACGMGFMTKGFLAWLLPVLIALPYALWQKRWPNYSVTASWRCSWPLWSACRGRWPCTCKSLTTGTSSSGTSISGVSPVTTHSTTQPWWFYLPLLVAFSLPWVALLPSTVKQAWVEKRLPKIAFLLLWLLMPLAFFSLSQGQVALLYHAVPGAPGVVDGLDLDRQTGPGPGARTAHQRRVEPGDRRVGGAGLELVLQLKNPVYAHGEETLSLVLVFIFLIGWIVANLLQAVPPLDALGRTRCRQLVAGRARPCRAAALGGL